jgi:ribosomal protein S25
MSQGPREKKVRAIEIPDPNSEEVMGVLKKMKAITPTAVAAQFNLKVSAAKKMLEDLEQQNKLNLEASSSNLKVYSLKSS